MGRIPTVTSQISARSGRTTAGVPSPRASADAFGAATGRGLQALGQGVVNLGEGVFIREEKKRKEDAANAVAQADFTRRELEIRNEVGADAAGYQERTLEEYDAWVDEQAESIEDDQTRTLFKQRMAAQRPSVSSRAAQYELGTAAENSRFEANQSLTALDNKIRLAPGSYDEYVNQGIEVIDARDDVPQAVKAQMKDKWREASALSRFEGILEKATSIEDVQALQEELREGERDWTKELSSEGMERVLSLADAASRSIQTKADADARAAIDYLEGRASDVTSIIPREELAAAQEVVAASNNPVTQARMARIVRDQDIIIETRKMTPAQQRDVIDTRYNNPSLPSRVNGAITEGARLFGVSPSYLAATVQREYGQQLKPGADGEIDYGQGNAAGASSAVGPMQFLEGTWLGEVINQPDFLAAIGLDTTGMSKQELLDLRKDPDIAIMGGAYWSSKNARGAEGVLGRKPNDAEMYMMHFMGPAGGRRLFRLVQSNPNMDAAHLFPEAAKANSTVYYKKDGTARTVRELYNELGRRHGSGEGSETYIEYGDRETRQKVLEDTEKRVNDDPMDFSFKNGIGLQNDIFEPGGMAARGEQARSVADYYSIPADQMKPFTKEEEQAIKKSFLDGDADDVLGILTSIQEMGGPMAKAAMRQIGNENDVFAYAGGMQLETGQGSVASDIVRGQKRIDENPDMKTQIGANESEISDAFMRATGGALLEADPAQRQSIMKAATAHYVETAVARGKAGVFDQTAFETSVQAVLGARKGDPAVDTVNGQKTVLPPGVTGELMEEAFAGMTVADWTSMSVQGLPPRYITGQIADPEDLADEAALRAVGGGQYKIMLSDGTFLVTGRPDRSGRLEAYLFQPTADRVRDVAERGTAIREEQREEQDAATLENIDPTMTADRSQQRADIEAANADGVIDLEEQMALFKKYGTMWELDAEGNRIPDQ